MVPGLPALRVWEQTVLKGDFWKNLKGGYLCCSQLGLGPSCEEALKWFTRRKLSSVTWSSGAARWGCPFSVYCFPHRIAFVWAFSEVVIWKESWQSAFRVVAVGWLLIHWSLPSMHARMRCAKTDRGGKTHFFLERPYELFPAQPYLGLQKTEEEGKGMAVRAVWEQPTVQIDKQHREKVLPGFWRARCVVVTVRAADAVGLVFASKHLQKWVTHRGRKELSFRKDFANSLSCVVAVWWGSAGRCLLEMSDCCFHAQWAEEEQHTEQSWLGRNESPGSCRRAVVAESCSSQTCPVCFFFVVLINLKGCAWFPHTSSFRIHVVICYNESALLERLNAWYFCNAVFWKTNYGHFPLKWQ